MAIRFGFSSSINGLDEMLGCESLSLSLVRSIEDGVLRFCHVAREEEAPCDCVHLIVIVRCRHMSIEVYRAHLILAFITLQMND